MKVYEKIFLKIKDFSLRKKVIILFSRFKYKCCKVHRNLTIYFFCRKSNINVVLIFVVFSWLYVLFFCCHIFFVKNVFLCMFDVYVMMYFWYFYVVCFLGYCFLWFFLGFLFMLYFYFVILPYNEVFTPQKYTKHEQKVFTI